MVKPGSLILSAAVFLMSALVVACGAGSGEGETASTYTPGQKVSANNSSRADLQAAFENAQISNAGKWAREVEEYRPYPEDDPDYTRLRGELAKYNPAVGVVDRIIAQLELP